MVLALALLPLATTAAEPIKAASEYDYPPFALVTKDGQADGFAVELLRAALHAMGREVEFKVGPWHEIKRELALGQIQVLPLVARTEERHALYDFTAPYLSMHGTLVVRRGDSRIHGIGDLSGKTIVVMKGDVGEEYVRRHRLGDKLVTTDTVEQALRQLDAGQHDVLVIQTLTAESLIRTLGLKNLRTVGAPLANYQDFCFAVREGDKELLALLNEGLALVIADGALEHLREKWIVPTRDQRLASISLLAAIVIGTLLLSGLVAWLWLRSLHAQVETATAQLTLARDELQRFFNLVPEPLCIASTEGHFLKINPAWTRVLGYEAAELMAQPFLEFVHPDDREATRGEVARQTAGHASLEFVNRYRCKDGSYKWLEWHSTPAADSSRMYAAAHDITEQRQAEERLKIAASVFSCAREGIMVTEADGAIVDVNDTFTRITGYTRNEVLGKNPRLLGSGRHDKEFYAAMWRSLIEKGHWYGEIWNRNKNGAVYAEILNIGAVRDTEGNNQRYVAIFSDITALKEHEQQLEHIAHYDALTGLPNRMLLADRLHQGMAQAQRRGLRLAVAYLDLDGFKAINDKHGHEAGDMLLISLAKRFRQCLRQGDTIARLGGDEFVAVLLDLPDIETSVPMLTRLLADAAEPMMVGDLVLQVSASLGVTFYPQQDAIDADQLMRQADQSMYQAKLEGKNRYHVFDAEHDRSVRGQHESLDQIRAALLNEEFVLHYQPKVNMRSGKLVGAEALIRWQHPEKGLLPPAEFLSVIEDHPLATELGEFVIDKALTEIARWHAAGLHVPVSVNVGAYQLQQANFVERLSTLLAMHPDVARGSLEIEVLETSALGDLVRISKVIEACREIGVSFALDDFGTGYSSLTYLKRLPVALLKIDQSFVRDMLNDPDDLAIVEGVLGLSAAFRREVIAEGVETVEHGAMLLQLGCNLAQGYGIARPMPAHRLADWLNTWHTHPSWSNLPPVSRRDLPLLFAGAEHRAWIAAIETSLKSETEELPLLDHHQCRFGHWLEAEGLAHYVPQTGFQSIEQIHQQVHALAAELCELHTHGRIPEALARLGELHRLQDELLKQLKVPESESLA